MHILFSIIIIFIVNYFSPITHIYLNYNIFNIIMISCFDFFGIILCIILEFIL
ncbi:MAG: pro-sigmaK processing inhibitor BofA family protein [Erysipelotrichaceae bacterium]|nr:pro-sigmaK processing inhibitor BofA family protein [Erysipelotrichaceae bacterium]